MGLSALFVAFGASALGMPAPALGDPEIVVPDSTGFTFTDQIILPTTSVKDQNKSGTCWAFSGVSALEDDVLRRGAANADDLDLSEMFIVRQAYIDKAKKYVRMEGKINFAQGGGFADVLGVVGDYGIVPEKAYAGLEYGEKKHSHYEMADVLTSYLDAVLRNGNKKLSTAWLPGFVAVLDTYLGKVPETFSVEGKTYTPKEYARHLGLDASKFHSFTSYSHHPFYEEFALEIPDNWQWKTSMNLPIDDLMALIDNALEKGYTVAWAADVSEPTFKWREGYAVLPEEKSEADMEGTELARWVQLSDKDREKEKSKVSGPGKEREITQEVRQEEFDNRQTTDDHGMVIIGTATDQEGNKYYKVKNSWDTNQLYGGYIYASVPYVKSKTLSVTVHEDAVPKDIAKKINSKK